LGLPRKAVRVTTGRSAARKLVAVEGLDLAEVERLIGGRSTA
jgi:hypothetical protein